MNKTKTLLSVTILEDDRSSVLIDAGEAGSFHKFLIENKFNAIAPTEAIHVTTNYVYDGNGKIIGEAESLEMEILVNASQNDLEPVIQKWLETKM